MYLYVIKEWRNGPIKIGVSGNPWARLLDLQVGNPRHLKLAHHWEMSRRAAFDCEREIHKELEEFRLEGEWFDFPDDIAGQLIKDHFLEGAEPA